MDSAWRNDMFSFAMHRRVDVAYGSKSKRKAVIEGDAEFVVINYAGVELVEDAIASGGFDLIIVDEATHYKNAQTKRWKALNRLLQTDNDRYSCRTVSNRCFWPSQVGEPARCS